MKRKYICVTSFFLCVALFSVLFAMSQNKSRDRQNDYNKSEQSKQVDISKSMKISDKTKYVLEIYQGTTDSITRSEECIPAEFAGKTRIQLQKYIDKYLEEPTLEDDLKGMTDMEIISFSSEKLVIRKTYQDFAKENRFFIKDENGQVVVYYKDKETVFQYTGISTAHLADSDRDRLTIGFYIKDESHLYSILECYSS